MRLLYFIILSLFLFFSTTVKADSWRDPSWAEMLDKSSAIAMVEYTTQGNFGAAAKVIAVYKGNLKSGEQVWLTNYSNQYGPIDIMHVGDRYIVFLTNNEPDKDGITFCTEAIDKDPINNDLKLRLNLYQNNKAFYISTPTSGDLRVNSDTVQYILTQTTYYEGQNYYPLQEFELFLMAYFNQKACKAVFKNVLDKLKKSNGNEHSAQHLMMLQLLNYNKYNINFKKFVSSEEPAVRYALAKLMGNIRSRSSREILIALLLDKNSIVQGEAVRQLKTEPTEIVGPIFLKCLSNASLSNYEPNIMNPVRNNLNGGMAEVLQALAEMKYKPAIPYILPMLDTDDEQLFEQTVETLRNMGTKEYAPYISKQLDENNIDFAVTLAEIIAQDSLVECLPSLRGYIARFDRSKPGANYYIISWLSKFTDPATKAFIYQDFNRFFTLKDSLMISSENQWTRAYIEALTYLKIKKAKPLMYKYIFDWVGVNEDFIKSPRLFNIKDELEAEVRTRFDETFVNENYILSNVRAYIQNTSEVLAGIKPVVKYKIEVNISDKYVEDYEVDLIKIQKGLNLPEESIFLKSGRGLFYIKSEERFTTHISSSPVGKFLDYIVVFPTIDDLNFLIGLQKRRYFTDEGFDKDLEEAILKVKNTLKN